MTRDRPCPAGHVHCQLPWLMAVLMAWLAACGSGAHALTAVQPEGLQSEPAAALGPPTPATPPAPSPIAAVASPAGTPVPAAPDVSFAPPVLLQVGDKRLPAVLVTNRSAEVTSFTIAATWRKDDDTLATAHGAVIDLLPRQTRAANLVIQSAPPDGAQAEAHVDRMLPAGDPHRPAAASRIQFGPASVERGGLSHIWVTATNMDDVPHGFSVGAALLAGGVLVGTASGSVTDEGPHLSLPVSLAIAGRDDGYDQILVYVTGVSH